ncbi:MAG: 1,4-dihydroxy-2-naphthoate polyprenyltransferase [Candidatus Dormibacteraeota bacterium]|nr:1,4-dihydroxy-2-naphthoate polyprenyltransferase [Candidatus Dormibacteraeota bacterium]
MWLLGARPRTLVAAVVPVAVGAASVGRSEINLPRTLLALVVGVALQIGVNYANDYFDGVSGVDTTARLGPPRLVASGMAEPQAVAAAAIIAVGIAAAAGVVLAAITSPWLLLAGVVAVAALALYSGGPRPYAGLGLGEVAVFLFFGLLATCGTAYVQQLRIPAGSWWLGASCGLLAVALLMANNLRDIPTDAASGKRTLAVRVGDRGSRTLLAVTVAAGLLLPAIAAAAGILPRIVLLALVAAPLAVAPLRAVRTAHGRELIAALLGLSKLYLAYGALLTALLLIA